MKEKSYKEIIKIVFPESSIKFKIEIFSPKGLIHPKPIKPVTKLK